MRKQEKFNQHNSRLILEELEERRLFSGGIEGLIQTQLDSDENAIYADIEVSKAQSQETSGALSAQAAEQQSQEIVFVDAGVDNHQQLVDDLLANSDSSRNIEVVVLDRDQDGIEQISATLQGREDLDAIHIISHGSDGSVELGNTSLDADTLEQNSLNIALWTNSFAETGDILIYGCNLAASEVGQSLITDLGALTLTDVAASDDLTGAATLGGDWKLEFSAGTIEASIALTEAAQANFDTVLSTFTVDNTDDSGIGSFRQAIIDANASANSGGADVIAFNIGADGSQQTINLLSALDPIDEAVEIDGFSQYGALTPAGPIIEINGAGTTNVEGLTLAAGSDGSTIRGLVINRFDLAGLKLIDSDNHTIVGNYIGTDVTGTLDRGNGSKGIQIENSADNQIGGSAESDRNVISGNSNDGIVLLGAGSTGNVIQGNYIGVDVTGNAALGNGADGINIGGGANDNTVGGTTADARNIISGNSSDGIRIENSTNNLIQGNYIGTNASATAALGNGDDGVSLMANATSNTVGGTTADARNIISGNDATGIYLEGSDNLIQGNYIGTDITGTLDLGNGKVGLEGSIRAWSAGSNTIGGTVEGAGNIIAFGGVQGIELQGTTAGISILGNSIFSNTGIGIDLNDDGVTANDTGDGDGLNLSNNLQNFPVLSSADTYGSQVDISGSLNSTANSFFRIEFFASTGGPDQNYLGYANVATDGSGNATINSNLIANVADGTMITATATQSDAAYSTFTDTSEFAANIAAVAVSDDPVVNDAPYNAVPTTQTIEQNGMLLFSSTTGTSISINDLDAGASLLEVTLTATNGTLNLSGDQGLSFSAGDGSADTTMTFTGTITDINTALEGMTFSATPGFTGAAGVQIITDDQGNTGTGGALSDTDSVVITVAVPDHSLWMTFEDDEAATGNAELADFTGGDIVNYGGTLTFESGTTSGSFSKNFNLDLIAGSDGDTRVDAVHYVTRDLSVGGVDLQAGDLIMSTADTEIIDGVTYTSADVLVFRPTTAGDYSAGSFFMLIAGTDSGLFGNVTGISLVEQQTTLGDVTLNAGDFLIAHDGSLQNIDRFEADELGATTSGTVSMLVKGNDIDIGENIGALHLVQQDTAIGDTSLLAGQLMVGLVANDNAVGDTPTINVLRQDLFLLDVTATGDGTSAATATRFFEGLDENLDSNAESIWGISAQYNVTPTATDAVFAIDENSANATVVGTVTATDPENGVLTYAITSGNTGGAFTIDASSGQITVKDGTLLDHETQKVFNLTVAAIDDKGAYDSASVTIDVNNLDEAGINDAPENIVPADRIIDRNGMLLFSTATGTQLAVTDFDIAANTMQVTLTATNGTINLARLQGLSFSLGDGSDDATMTFTGTLTDINAALEGATFVAASNFVGAASLQIVTDDQGGTGTGGPQSDTDLITIQVQPREQSLWLTFENDFASTGNADIPSITGGDVVTYGDITQTETSDVDPLASVTAGSFGYQFNLDLVAGTDGNTRVDAVHFVNRDLMVGGVQVNAGDLLLSNDGNEVIDGVTYGKEDVFVFRPDSEGDYGSGSFFMLIDGSDIGLGKVTGITLVAKDTQVGDVTLNQGDILLAHDGSGNNIVRFEATSLGDTTSGSTSILIQGADVGIDQKIAGLQLVDTNTIFGGRIVEAGQLLISLKGDDASVGNLTPVDVKRQDIFVLNVTATGAGTSDATASRLFEGLDESLDENKESIQGIGLQFNAAPRFAPQVLDVDENSGPGTVVGTVTASDPNGDNVHFAILSGNDGDSFQIDAITGQITVLDGTLLDHETQKVFYLSVAAIDDFGAARTTTITVNINNLDEAGTNDSPENWLPADQTINEDGMLVFSSSTGTAISISDFDDGGSPVEVTLTATNGTLNLSGTQGLVFSVGDGSADSNMTFTGTLTDINAALEGATFVATPGFTGSAGLQIITDDQGNTGTGGALTDTDNLAITVQSADQKLWMTFQNDQAATGNGDIPSITGGDVVTFGDITQLETSNTDPLASTTSGTLAYGFNLDTVLLSDGVTPASDGNTIVDAVHLVTRDIQVGSNNIQLQNGDILLSTDANEKFDGVTYGSEDLFVFRPDTKGDYSQGSFFLLIDGSDVGLGNITGISLVEQDTVVGGVTLNAGEFLVAHDGSGKNIDHFVAGTLGDVTTGTASVLIDGGDIDIGQDIGGLLLVQNDTEIAGSSVAAGQLLVSLKGSDTIVGDVPTIDVKRQDIFVLDVTATGSGTTTATATRFFEGLDQNLDNNNESIWGIGYQGNAGPTIDADTFALDENSAGGTVVGSVTAADPELGVLQYAITAGNIDGAFAIDAATGQITVANSAALDFETNKTFSLTVAAIDPQGAYGTATVTINLNNLDEAGVNDAPENTLPADQTIGQDGMLLFSSSTSTAISISDFDDGGSPVEVTLNLTNGTLNLSGTQGLVFSVGDGSADTNMTFTGSITDINAALEGATFVVTPGFTGGASLQITTDDQGNTGTGGPLTDTDSLNISVLEVEKLWLTFANDEAVTGNSDIPTITGGDVVTFFDITQLETSDTDPLASTTSGSLAYSFNLDTVLLSDGETPASDGDTRVGAVHYVTRDIQVGSNNIQLLDGDILLATDTGETIDGVIYAKEDLFVFRPDTAGDYSQGSFFMLIDGSDVGLGKVTGISLVEQDTVVGGVTLNAGEFLLAHDGSTENIDRFVAGSLGDTTTGTASVLIAGADIDFDQRVSGLHLVHNDTVIGGTPVTAGQLLVSLKGEDAAVGDAPTIDTLRQDIFVLDVTATGVGTTAATASRFFEGLDLNFDSNNESISGIGYQGNAAPMINADVFAVDENSVNGTVVGSVTAAEPELDTLSYAITAGNTDGAFAIDAATGQITVANSLVLDFETTPIFNLTVAAIDPKGAYDTATVTVNLNDMNEAPVNSVPGAQTVSEDTSLGITGISVNDVDGNLATTQVSVSNGSLNVSLAGGATISGGANDSNTLTLSGTQAEINAALASLSYQGNNNFNGSDTLTILSTDSDGTPLSDSDDVAITVTAVNDAGTFAGDAAATTDEDTGTSGTVTFADTADGFTTANFSLNTAASNGVAAIDAAGNWTYTPNAHYNGADSFIVQVTDDDGNVETQTINITVSQVDDAGTFAGDVAATTDEDTGTSGTVTFADTADGFSTPNFNLNTPAGNGVAAIDAAGNWTYTPNANYNGADSFVVEVTDDDGNVETRTINITVSQVGDAGTFAGDVAATTDEDTGTSGTVTFADTADGFTTANFSINTAASNGVAAVDAAGNWTYTPNANYNGADSFTVQVTDDDGNIETQVISLTVTQIDDTGTFGGDTAATTNEDTATAGTVTFADTADGFTTANFSINTAASNGVAAIDAAGNWTYTPTANYNGADSFVVEVTDNDGNVETQVISLTVTQIDDTGTFGGDTSATTNEDTATAGTVTFSDTADGFTTANFSINTAASNGVAAIDPAGNWTYTPNANYNGADSFTVQVTDDDGNVETQVISLTVTQIDDTGSFGGNTSATTNEDTATAGTVTFSDTADGFTTANFSINTAASNGVAAIDAAGNWTYTPTANYNGADSFTVQVTDDDGNVETQVVSITVTQIDDTGTFGGDTSATTNEDTATGGTVTFADTADGFTTANFSINTAASNGIAAIDAAGNWTYTPTANYNGADSFVVEVTDDDGNVETQTINITVNQVDDAGTFGGDTSATTNEDTATAGTVTFADTADGFTTPNFSLNTAASNGVAAIDAAGNWTYTPNANYNGADSFTVQVTDDDGNVETQTINITVNQVDDAGTFGGDTSATTNEDTATAGTVTFSDAIDGFTTANFSINTAASNGVAAIDAAGNWTYTPNANYNGADSFVVEVTDDDGNVETQTINITVNQVDDAGTFAGDTSATTNEDTATGGTVTFADTADGFTTANFSLNTAASNGVAAIDAAGNWTYTPNANYNGADSFIVEVTDDDGNVETQTINITVNQVDDAGTFAGDVSATTNEDTATGGTVTFADTADGFTTPNFSLNTAASNGVAAIDAAGNWTYTPNANYNGADSFIVEVTDDDGNVETQTINITVNQVDDAGTFAGDTSATTNEDTATGGTVTFADTADGFTTANFSINTAASNGVAAIDAAGNWTYTPNANYNGADSFVVEVTDDDGNIETQTINITVNQVDDAGTFAGDTSATTNEDTATGGTVTFADTADGFTTANFSLITPAGNGIAAIDAAGNWTYTPNANYNGADSFIVEVIDDDGNVETQIINITVNQVNDAPTGTVAVSDTTPVDGQTLSAYSALADAEGMGTITFTWKVDGSTVGTGSNYTVTAADIGKSITVEASYTDGQGTAETVSSGATNPVGDANDAPVLIGANDLTAIDEDDVTNGGTLVSDLIAGQVSDPDGALVVKGIAVIAADDSNGTWEYTTDGGSNWSTFGAVDVSTARLLAADANTSVRFVPNANWNGTVTDGITFHAWDQTAGTVGDTLDLTVAANETLMDQFGTASYANDDGTQNWTTDWIENDGGAADGPSSGHFMISGGELHIETKNVGDYIYRQADLSDALSATLSFSYDNRLQQDSTLEVQISDDGGVSYATFSEWTFDENTNPGIGTKSIDLSSFMSADTQIRFYVSGKEIGANKYDIYIDDLQIEYETGGGVGGNTSVSAAPASSSVTVTQVDDAGTFAGDVAATTDEDTGTAGTVTFADTADGFTTANFSINTAASNGVAAIDAAGNWTYTPTANFNGSDSFTVQVTDDDGNVETQVISLTVTPIDDAGTFAGDVSATTNEDTATAGTATFTDAADGFTTANFSLNTPAGNGIAAIDAAGNWTYTPNANYNGADSFIVEVTDDDGNVETQTINITVNQVDDAGTFAGDVSATTNEDTATAGTVTFADAADGFTTANFSINTAASNGVAAIDAAGNWTYTPTASYNGADSFTVQVTDDDGNAETQTINITVNQVDDAGTFGGDVSATTNEDTATAGTVTFADTADGFTTANFSLNTAASNGVAAIDAAGNWTYTPTANYNGADSFVVEVTDDDGNVETQVISLTVTPVDDAGTFGGDTAATTNEDTATAGTVTFADTADGFTTANFSINTAASNGVAAIDAAGNWTYTPTANYNGADSFVVEVTDDDGNVETQVISLTVTPIDDAGTFGGDTAATTNEDTATAGTVTFADTADGFTTANFSINTAASNGVAAIDAAGNWTYTPTANYNGADSFTVQVTDDDGNVETQVISLTVTQIDDAGTFGGNTSATTNEDTATAGTVTFADTADGFTTANFSINTAASNGAAAIDAAGNWTYTPTANYNGADSFIVEVTDDDGNVETQTINITVNQVDDAGTFAGDVSATTDEDTGTSGTVTFADTADGFSSANFSLNTAASNGVAAIDAAGNWTYTPTANYNGADSFTVQVTDDDGNVETQTINITVNQVDDVGTFAGDVSATTNEDTATGGTVTFADTADGFTTANFSLNTAASNGVAAIDAAGNWTYTPNANYNGADSFVVEVTDDDGNVETQVISLTVTPVDDAGTFGGDTAATTNEDTATAGTVTFADTADGFTTANFSINTAASNGVAAIDAAGNWTYTPTANFNGSDSFTVQVTDDDGNIETQVVSITVTQIDDTGSFGGNTSATTNEDTATAGTVTFADAADGFTTPNFAINTAASNGVAAIDAAGNWTYTSTANYNGADSFTVQVTDDDGNVETQVISLTVTQIDDTGTFAGDTSATTNEDTATAGTVTFADTVDGFTTANFSINTAASNGVAAIDAAGNWTYTPTANYNGADSFTVQVTDDDGNVETQVISLTVTQIDDAGTFGGNTSATTNEDTATAGTVTFADTADGFTTANFSINTAASNGVAAIDAAGNWTYTPTANYNGADSFTVQVTDDDGNVETQVVSITVTQIDDTGSFGGNTSATTNEDTATAGTVTFSDTADGFTTANFSINTAASNGVAAIDAAGNWTYTPNANYNGADSFTVQVTDDDGNVETQTINITVNQVDDAGTFGGNTSATTNEDTATAGTVTFSDTADGFTTANFSINTAASNGVAAIDAAGNWTYTPTANYNGADSFTVQVTDDDGNVETQVISLTVTQIDDAGTFGGNTSATTNEDTATAGTVTFADAADGFTTANFSINTAASNGVAAIDAAGNWTYTPTANYNGADSFTVQVTDDDGNVETQVISLTVTQIDDTGTFGGDTAATTNEDTATAGTVTFADAADGFTTPNFSINTAASNGVAAVDAAGNWTYTPTANYNGADSFTVQVTDDDGNVETQVISLTVTQIDDTGTFGGDTSATTNEDTATAGTVTFADAADGFTTPNFSINTAASNGVAAIDAAGNWTYTPTANYNGADSFTVQVTDDDGNVETQVISLTVTPIDDAGTFSGDTAATTNEDTATAGTVTFSDTADGFTTANFSINTAASNGVAAIDAAGNWTYTPTANYNGSDSFTVQVTDDDGNVETQVISITVNQIDDTGSFGGNTSATTNEDTATAGTVTFADTADGFTTPNFSLNTAASNGVAAIDAAGNWTYTPNANYNGADSFTVEVTDDDGNVETQTINITVNQVDDAGTFAGDVAATTDEDTGTSGTVTFADAADGFTTANFSINTAASNGVAAIDAAGNWTYTPNANYNGADSFIVEVTDDDGNVETQVISLTVTPIDDAGTFSGDTAATTNEDTATGGTVTFADAADGFTTANFSLNTAASNGVAAIDAAGNWTYTPNANYNGSDSFTVQVTDDDGNVETQTINITVSQVDDAGTFAGDVAATTDEDTGTSGTVTFADTADGFSSANFSLNTPAGNGVAAIDAAGNWTYTPNSNYNGADSFTVQVTDDEGNVETQTINITVNQVDDAGTFAGDVAATTDEDTGTSGTVTFADTADGFTTPNFSINTAAGNGVAAIDAAGNWTYTPTANYNGADSFTVQVTDDDGNVETRTINITISQVDDAGTFAGNLSGTAAEGVVVTGTLTATDVDGLADGTYFTVTGAAPANGTAAINPASGAWTFTPTDPDWFGSDSFEVTLTDDEGGTTTQIISVTLTNTDDLASIGGNLSGSAAEGVAITGTLTATDADGLTDGTYFTVTGTLPINGTAAINPASGAWTFTPTDPDWFGSDSFEVTVTDDQGGTTTQVINVTLINVNDPAVFGGDITGSANEGVTVTGTLTATDVDGLTDGTYFTVTGTLPSNGTAAIDPASGAWTFTPTDPDWVGSESFEVTVTDDVGNTTTQVINVTLINVDDAPVIGGDDTGSVSEDVVVVAGNISTSGSLTIADPDAGESSFVAATINGLYGDLIIDAAGNWQYRADNGQAEIQFLQAGDTLADTLAVTTADGNTHEIVITINGKADAAPEPSTGTEPPVKESLADEEKPPAEEDDVEVAGAGTKSSLDEIVRIPQGTPPPPPSTQQDEVDQVVTDAQQVAQPVNYGPEIDKRDVQKPLPANQPSLLLQNLNLETLGVQVSDDELLNERYENELLDRIDRMHQGMDSDGSQQLADDVEVQIIMGSTVSLTAGIVSWVLRGGSLLASFMSTVPLLNRFDPLPILKAREDEEDVEPDDDTDTEIPGNAQARKVDKMFSGKGNARQ